MKKLCVFVFFIVLIFNLSAEEHNFSIGTSFGLLNGQAQEIVYMNSISDNKLSELLWNFKPLSYIGLDIKYSSLKPENKVNFFANGLLKLGIPGKTGVMEDRDWIMVETYPDWLTHYSVHDNETKSAILADLNLGMSFLIFQKFLLKTYLSYHFMNFLWTASGGSFLYPMEYDNINDKYYDGHGYLELPINICTYEQTWNIVSPAISFYGEFNRFFDIEIAFEVTPFIWCTSKDGHLLRDLVVTDDLKGGIFIEPSLLFSYKPTEHFVLSFFFSYREISKSRGNSVYVFQEPPYPTEYPGVTIFINPNGSGAGYTAFDIGIIAKWKIVNRHSDINPVLNRTRQTPAGFL